MTADMSSRGGFAVRPERSAAKSKGAAIPWRTKTRAIACAASFLIATTAFAQTYPTRPVRLIVPASTGTGMDHMGRSLAQVMSEQYKQQVIIDNRAGAGSLIGTGIVAGAAPDGYTLGVASTSSIVAPLLQSKPPYRPLEDLVQIALLSSLTSVLVVAPNVPAKNVKELIALAKAKPGQLNFASVGAGSLIGTGIVAGAAPDGYTLGVASTSSIVAPLLQAKPPYNPLDDLVQIALLSSLTSVVVVAPGVPAKTLKDFIAYA